MTRVAFVGSSALRFALDALLRSQPDFEVMSYADLRTALRAAADVVLYEPPPGGKMAALGDTAPMVVLTDYTDAEWLRDTLGHGVRAVVPRDAPGEEIVGAVQAAAGGLVAMDPEVFTHLFARPTPSAYRRVEILTAREAQVLQLLAEGDGNKEIASKLGISEHTAKFHVASTMGKLDASSRTEAVTIGIRRGLVLL